MKMKSLVEVEVKYHSEDIKFFFYSLKSRIDQNQIPRTQFQDNSLFINVLQEDQFQIELNFRLPLPYVYK